MLYDETSGGEYEKICRKEAARILDAVARKEGFLMCPEGGATFAAYQQSLAEGRVAKTDRVVLFNCATGLKYPLPKVDRTLDRFKPIDYAKL